MFHYSYTTARCVALRPRHEAPRIISISCETAHGAAAAHHNFDASSLMGCAVHIERTQHRRISRVGTRQLVCGVRLCVCVQAQSRTYKVSNFKLNFKTETRWIACCLRDDLHAIVHKRTNTLTCASQVRRAYTHITHIVFRGKFNLS